jgi:hypothetical protein
MVNYALEYPLNESDLMTHRISLKIGMLTCIFVALQGCASLTTSNEQSVRVETYDDKGVEVVGATCAITKGTIKSEFTTPTSIPLRRGSDDVFIDCRKGDLPMAKGQVTSRANANTFGNFLLGGPIGVVIDQSTGKAYSYPEWIRLVFGSFLAFDKKDATDAQPLLGRIVGQTSVDAGMVKAAPATSVETKPAVATESPTVAPATLSK